LWLAGTNLVALLLLLLLLQPLKVEKKYEQQVTIDHNHPPPVLHDVILKEKPSVEIKVTSEHEKRRSSR
jgi:hypothetical protein